MVTVIGIGLQQVISGRFNYDYDGKYLAEFNIRYDGSSRFLADKRWAWFPSVSFGMEYCP